MKIKTSEATPLQLNWLVGTCEGDLLTYAYEFLTPTGCHFMPTTDWSQGGPIIEREVDNVFKDCEGTWFAIKCHGDGRINSHESGPTPLIAAMRCYVASKLGDAVDVPEELFCNT